VSASVLVVDDDPGVRYTLREILLSAGLHVVDVDGAAGALVAAEQQRFDLVITDLKMPGVDGLGLLRALLSRGLAKRVVVLTAHGSERTAVEAMRAGAWDYFHKPFDVDDLLALVDRAVEAVTLERDNERLAGERTLGRTMVFASPAMSRLAVLVQRVAPRDVTVLITGESGTGKERVAEALVLASGRAQRPYVTFNCASVTPELAEAELFGHTKGAFTGAARARPGLFGEADGGTLFLDEIGELDLGTQARLLRALQEGEIRPVGEERPRKVDVRIVAATHRDLSERVARGQFREDLYYRLNVVNLHVPPLRDRPEDIPVLVQTFLLRFAERFGTGPIQLPPGLLERMCAWAWPGNVRELQNTVERMVALSSDGGVDASLMAGGAAPPVALGLRERVDAYERGLLVEAMRACGGNQAEAARRLGVPRVTLHDRLKKHGLVS
jgi:two-component system response regulator HydG